MKGTNALAMICGFVFAIGCATGSEDIGVGDDGLDPDAMGNHNVVIDARPLPIDANLPIDSSIPIDASLPIDAAGGLAEGSPCTGSAQCASACCLAGFNACFPDPGLPGACM